MTKIMRLRTPKLNKETYYVPVFLMLMVLCGLMIQGTGYFIYLNSPSSSETSTGYRYDDGFAMTLNNYAALSEIYLEERSFATPGLVSTNILGNASNQMVPQGICKAGDYILISAYDSTSKKWLQNGRKVQNSVIYIMSENGEFLNTLVLPDVNHVGGLTFDGRNVWIAKSGNKTCSLVSYDVIKMAAEHADKSVQLDDYLADMHCDRDASFVEYHDGKLWIGTFSGKKNGYSEVGIYEIGDADNAYKLRELNTLKLPAKAQGLSFYEVNGEEYIIVSTSYGRKNNSIYYMYKLDVVEDVQLLTYRGKCEMPPMSEGVFNDGVFSYMVFESAATKYSTNSYYRCEYPIDRICVVENEKLLQNMME